MTFSTPIADNSPQAILEAMGVSVKGNIRCVRCHNSKLPSKKTSVCSCGRSACYISLYWQGKQYRFFRYVVDREVFDVKRALKQLTEMNLAIDRHKFNPADWIIAAVSERLLPAQADKWLSVKEEEAEADELSPETLKNYRGYARNYIAPFFKTWDVREIRYEQLEAFKDSLRGKVKGIKTRRNILNALHALFAWMRRKGIIEALPVWPVLEGDNSRARTAIDYQTQADALQRLPEAHRDPIEFGFETGLRPGETCALRVKDVDLGSSAALIQRTWAGPHLRETTKGKNKRWIPLSDRALEIARRNVAGKLPEAWLFTNPETGRRYTVKKLNQVWRQHSGLDIDHYSASRHSFCTQLVEGGVNPFQAQALMRHADQRSTQKYYHSEINLLREALKKRGGKVVNIAKTSIL